VHYEFVDFNGAEGYFSSDGLSRWDELDQVLSGLVPQLQASDQAGKSRAPIFDPKATNGRLTSSAASLGWSKVPVPAELHPFGLDWDAGKDGVLAEWQFSNYPFLWNNIIRSEAVFKSPERLPAMFEPRALVIVTKSGSWPASNSTLYFEQAQAQIEIVTTLGVFDIPIRLVGLMLSPDGGRVEADWNVYPGRYSRVATTETGRSFEVVWGRVAKHGNRSATLKPI
jgi:hypothetical protein